MLWLVCAFYFARLRKQGQRSRVMSDHPRRKFRNCRHASLEPLLSLVLRGPLGTFETCRDVQHASVKRSYTDMLGCPTKPACAVAFAAALHGLVVAWTPGCPWLACGPCAPACQCAGDATNSADLTLARSWWGSGRAQIHKTKTNA